MIYMWLNLFNEVIKTVEGKEFEWLSKKRFKEVCGFKTWEKYIIDNMSKPLLMEVFRIEDAWDEEFKDFVKKHEDALKDHPDPKHRF